MFESIMKEQFQLTYFGKVDYQSTNDMTTLERHMMYRLLVEQKEEERKAQEEADRIAREEEEKKAAAEAEAQRKAEAEAKKAEERQKKLDNLNTEKTDLEAKIADKDAAIESEKKEVDEFKAMLDGEEDEDTITSVKEEIKNHEISISSLKDERNKLQKKLNNIINQIRTM